MSQQALDLRRSGQIVRRHKVLVGTLVALGVLGGAAYPALKPADAHQHRARRAPAICASAQTPRPPAPVRPIATQRPKRLLQAAIRCLRRRFLMSARPCHSMSFAATSRSEA